jgi:hypothetical protein
MLALRTWKVSYEYEYPTRFSYQPGICSEIVYVQADTAKEAGDAVLTAGRKGYFDRPGQKFHGLRPDVDVEPVVPLVLSDSAVRKLRDHLADLTTEPAAETMQAFRTTVEQVFDNDRLA